MALTKIGTDGIKDDAVTTDKVANAINTSIAANTAKDLTALSASNLTSGTIPDARFPATLPAASGVNLTNVPVTTNLVINGAMQVAQRGTSSTVSNYGTVDRFELNYGGTDEAPTQSQVDVASGTTPYTLGFRKAYKATNGNQTSGAGTSDYMFMRTRFEAQDIANSGWNYLSSSSYITLSFWVKSSIAQTFPIRMTTADGTIQNYSFQYTISSADTWQKVTHTIPGNSNLTFDNNANLGLTLFWDLFRGTDMTDNSFTNNAWGAFSSSSRSKDQTSTWYTTNDATLEITGVQLEVGSVATDFKHRSFGQELALCQRYYFLLVKDDGSNQLPVMNAATYNSSHAYSVVQFPVQMRTVPTLDAISVADDFLVFASSGNSNAGAITLNKATNTAAEMKMDSSRGQGNAGFVRTTAGGGGFLAFTAEL